MGARRVRQLRCTPISFQTLHPMSNFIVTRCMLGDCSTLSPGPLWIGKGRHRQIQLQWTDSAHEMVGLFFVFRRRLLFCDGLAGVGLLPALICCPRTSVFFLVCTSCPFVHIGATVESNNV